MRVNMEEPDRSKPCWVLFGRGARGAGKFRKHVLELREYLWSERIGKWMRSYEPPQYPSTLNKALAQADWVGRLPNVANRKPVVNMKNLTLVKPLHEEGKSYRKIQLAIAKTGVDISIGSIKRLVTYIKEST